MSQMWHKNRGSLNLGILGQALSLAVWTERERLENSWSLLVVGAVQLLECQSFLCLSVCLSIHQCHCDLCPWGCPAWCLQHQILVNLWVVLAWAVHSHPQHWKGSQPQRQKCLKNPSSILFSLIQRALPELEIELYK